MALIRTFIAVEFSQSLKKELAVLQKDLKSRLGDLKWVPQANFHLTLKFLGDVESKRISEIVASLKEAVQDLRVFSLNLAGLGGFPKIDHPKVVWIGVKQGRVELIRLQQAVEDALAAQGFDRERRSYSPHLTLARSRDYTDLKAVGEALQGIKEPVTATDQVRSIKLMKSDLRPGGPVYTCLAEIPFQ